MNDASNAVLPLRQNDMIVEFDCESVFDLLKNTF